MIGINTECAGKIVAAVLVACVAHIANAQCTPEWDKGLSHVGHLDRIEAQLLMYNDGVDDDEYVSQILCAEVYDDGNGPALYVGGNTLVVGGAASLGISRSYDGITWEALGDALMVNVNGASIGATVEDMLVFDFDGPGPAKPVLVVGGYFNYINGGLGGNGSDDAADLIAAWDGNAWSKIGSGLNAYVLPNSPEFRVKSLASFDSGSGPRLYAGGRFQVEGIPNGGVAVWDGSAWRAVGFTGLTPEYSRVDDLVVHNDGTGNALYVSGSFDRIIGVANSARIAKWNGSAWSKVGPTGAPRYPVDTSESAFINKNWGSNSMVSFDADGAGPQPAKLIAITHCYQRLDTWDGSAWTSTNIPMAPWCQGDAEAVVFDDGSGPAVFFGATVDSQYPGMLQETRLMRYNGASFTPVGGPMVAGNNSMTVAAMAINTLHNPPSLFHSGGVLFEQVGDEFAMRGAGMLSYRGGVSTSLAPVGGPAPRGNIMQTDDFDSTISSVVMFDLDGPGPQPTSAIFSGEFFTMGNVVAKGFAARTGDQWHDLRAGLEDADRIYAPAVIDGPGGPELYVLAEKLEPGVELRGGVFKHDGTSWQPIGVRFGFSSSLANPLSVAQVLRVDLGTGAKLTVLGGFLGYADEPVYGAASWDGTAWSQIGDGLFIDTELVDSVVHNDGGGAAIFFSHFGGLDRWDGHSQTQESDGLLPLNPFILPRIGTLNGELIAVGAEADNRYHVYAWEGESASWTQRGIVPAQYNSTYVLSPIGVAHHDNADFLQFAVLNGYTGNQLSYVVLEFDGTTWQTNPALGRFVTESYERGDYPRSSYSVIDAPWRVISIHADGVDALWYAGPFAGVGGDFNTTKSFTLSATNSFHIARWSCNAPACPSDHNHVGGVTVQDIFDFLSDWFSVAPAADFNHVDGVTVQDIFDFLVAWFAGC